MYTIESFPLLETNEASSDVPFSCEGIVKPIGPALLHAPYTNLPCVYFHSITEVLRGSGKSRRWVITENNIGYIPFFVSDKRGNLKVDLTNIDSDLSSYNVRVAHSTIPDPDHSEIDCDAVLKHSGVMRDKFLGFIPASPNQRRSEFILSPDTRVFIHGYVSKRDNELVLHEHPDHPLIISKKTKDQYIEEFYKGRNLVFVLHLLLSIGFTISLLSLNYFAIFSPTIIITILGIGNLLLGGSIIFTMYNRIMTLKQRAHAAYSNIDIELKRRTDLIPQLEELVKKYTAYEKNMFQAIADLRVHIVLQNELPTVSQSNMSHLFGILEQYPELKAVENYKQLINALVDTEERIVYSRSFYNRNVRKLNTLIAQFPFILISILFNIERMDFLTLTHDETLPGALHSKITTAP